MNKAEALHIFATAVVRELLRDDEPQSIGVEHPRPDDNAPPMPRFDFDESNDVCEHGGMYIPRATCPVHGPSSEYEPTAEELDDITSEETPGMIQRARRLAEQRSREAKTGRLFPEDLPMHGLGPPDDLPPNLVV